MRSIAGHLAGDMDAAARLEPELPETGVCDARASSRTGAAVPAVSSCCGSYIAAEPARESAVSCYGGPAPAGVDACCAEAPGAKAPGASGCATDSVLEVAAAASCCG